MHQSLPKSIDYIEMPSRDLATTKQFFAALFGWSFEDYGPDYASFDDGRMVGGFFTSDQAWTTATAAPLIVFYSPDLAASLADVKRLGAEITREIFEFPGGRRFHFTAPGSGEFAIWSDK
jgi:predicted enzyme related to lactoylglutathione lyase